ncbi:regulator of protease activity HflC (stomatin/prohibitin superfamily) [Caulobacter ginsengisoli]|uniref:Regulator of protease activity HflC (Stomatin/prohibitin superfamily) n=1 Tax=Caulobacter ginsengisoli TaxID=400775 RepID=A0ABU0IQR4_9CAUL|nr:SPFH domain-containing protein [Caulobacter ginsengisoli]MDQ0463292.1 regulator of protease activity HflC (stomatin/prohibitin superfamily) [Caulobacter ginsengisoli]
MSDQRTINRSTERVGGGTNGGLMLLVFLGLLILSGFMISRMEDNPAIGIPGVLLGFIAILGLAGFYTIQPNQAVAITLFGNYKGTDRTTGLRWVLPWFARKKLSMRVRNVTSETLKVNDKRGNPVEIAANVVWRVRDSAQALFDVDDYVAFMNIQMETALREVARHYAYDHAEDEEPTLRADAEIVGERLRADLQERVEVGGIAVDEMHLMHLAYAPEIAGAMLRRQQAEAVLAARRTIVTGAVSMVESALQQLGERGVVQLDEERKAAMVSNLLVVLCGDRDTQPVVNTGTLYSG